MRCCPLHLLAHRIPYQYDCLSTLKYINDTQQVANVIAFLANLANIISVLQRQHLALGLVADLEGRVSDGRHLDVTK
ncbi:hypothetical protein C4D60_Mb06t19860 [Musa balbisiana]|uniref:Uncharacterized protein n=1 Tax=Musa balbisiana TaxID=52838 RepID=A0A4S8IQK4_MUSBA|nr:hypothetical protein C4D60_Mb06t19860 [Musa balbisiana]